jgi:B-cell receptor-associated protein 31
MGFIGAQAEYLRLQDEQNAKAGKGDEVLVEEVRSLKEIVSDLRQKLEQVQGDVNSKEKELKSAKANLKALEKQTEGFQNEYTRMMDDNENLRIQLSLFDRKYANSDTKKYS